MNLGERFFVKWRSQASLRLSCFDRVILTGYLPFWSAGFVNGWIAGVLGILHKDFLPQMKRRSDRLVAAAKAQAARAAAPFEYVQGRCRKEALIEQISASRGHPTGLLAVLCAQESGRTLKLVFDHKWPRFTFAYRPQRILYFYLNERDFGRMFVRVETWFPWRIQVYVNGHDWLAAQLRKKGRRFEQRDNAFVSLDDPRSAQRLADRFAALPWTKLLDRFAKRFNPLLSDPWLRGKHYYWVIDQAEYSTDVLFEDRSTLAGLYPRLLDHAVIHFSAQDVLTFLGRRLHPRYEGEVLTRCQKQRWPGARIKHRVGDNWLKMYDKFGRLLRVETVINCPRDFWVSHTVRGPAGPSVRWKRLCKSVLGFRRYLEVARAANLRYFDALAAVDATSGGYAQVRQLTESRQHAGRRYAGFNVARKEDVQLFAAVLAGEHQLHGFRAEHIRAQLHGACPDPAQRRRQAQAVARRLKRLHVRGLIAKIPRTRRWRATHQAHRLLGTIVRLYYQGLPNAA